ncbi:formylglycine-generating enzyme family protein [Maioricimonas rarisocia]|nr:SUMF1/EgtB/PvdO family nonheme iron enzyme [Maioricimonas rarisocia]
MKSMTAPRLVLLAIFVLSGCGGGSDAPETIANKPTPNPPPAKAVPANPAGVNREKPSAPARPPRPKPQTKPGKGETPEPPPPNAFMVGGKEPNFSLVSADGPREEDLFAVVTPAPAQNPAAMTIVPPRREATRVEPNRAFQLPEGFDPLPEHGYNANGIPLRIGCRKDGAVLALVPAGVFIQGTDNGPDYAKPAHPVYLDAFYIDVTEVTLEQYRKFQQERTPRPSTPLNVDDPDVYPATGITWRDALFYAKWAGRELPTEAEWEKAARGSESFRYPWGDDRVIWSRKRTLTDVTAVKSFPSDRSVYGVYDMAGNAREWCQDWYADDAYQQAREKDGTAVRNWEGPSRASKSSHRVVKGNGPGWNLWERSSLSMGDAVPGVGFRCVLRVSVPEPAEAEAADQPVRDPAVPPQTPPRQPPAGGQPRPRNRGF